PHPAVLKPFAVVEALLRKPDVVGALVGEIELECGVDGEVGLAHLGPVGLAVAGDLLAEIAGRERPGDARRPLKKLVICCERRRSLRPLSRFNRCHFRSGRFSQPCGKATTAYQSLTMSIKRIGKLLWQDRGNNALPKAATGGS